MGCSSVNDLFTMLSRCLMGSHRRRCLLVIGLIVELSVGLGMALHKIVDVSQGVVALLDEILTCALISGQDGDVIKLKTSVQLDFVQGTVSRAYVVGSRLDAGTSFGWHGLGIR